MIQAGFVPMDCYTTQRPRLGLHEICKFCSVSTHYYASGRTESVTIFASLLCKLPIGSVKAIHKAIIVAKLSTVVLLLKPFIEAVDTMCSRVDQQGQLLRLD